MFEALSRWFSSLKPRPLSEWFVVTFDDESVYLDVSPPLRKSWKVSFTWASVSCVCFKDEGLEASDGIYVFTTLRPESFVIPMQASGGSELFGKLVEKGLFPRELMVEALASTNGEVYCWPPIENSPNG